MSRNTALTAACLLTAACADLSPAGHAAGPVAPSVDAAACEVAPPTAGLVGLWTGDVDAADAFGASHGVLVGSAVAGAPGRLLGAFDFSGGDGDHVLIPSAVAQATPGDITIEAWVNPVGNRPGIWPYVIFTRGWDGNGGWGADLVHHTNDHVSFRIVPPPYTSHYDIQSAKPLKLGKWNHVVGIRRGGTIEIWLDGKVNATGAPVGPLRGLGESQIGTDRLRPILTDFDGLVDEVAVWSIALDGEVVQARTVAGRPMSCGT